MANVLNSGIKLVKNVGRYNVGASSLDELSGLLTRLREQAVCDGKKSGVIFLVDQYFKADATLTDRIALQVSDVLEFIPTKDEPKTDDIDRLVASLILKGFSEPAAVVGIGGGITMDYAKAVSNLLTNGGNAAQYQGWDLVKVPGIFKIGIPTISGTGAETTRTCVMTNPATGMKLGMNSDFTVFDHVIMDPELTATVPRDQYFFTGMDAYIHCIEALEGSYRNAIGDAYSRETINLCRQVFLEDDMQTPANREKLMVASYLGGCAIATSYVGLVHPLSAGLSVVLGIHHCVANCIVMRAMADYYPAAYDEFWKMAEHQRVKVPEGVCQNLGEADFKALYEASIMHQKPLTNALGENYKSILTQDKVTDLFKKM
ncbi:MAG: iron-containing alcohol dehydrogenase family protein [Methylovulum sp.]|nr:iron-containing alcohol dehydrogenase family protein [Methylovulum sp.]